MVPFERIYELFPRLKERENSMGNKLSGGEQQMLTVARGLMQNPTMILLDEITANLDAETEKAVLAALKRVAKDRTVISISHRTSAELGRIINLN